MKNFSSQLMVVGEKKAKTEIKLRRRRGKWKFFFFSFSHSKSLLEMTPLWSKLLNHKDKCYDAWKLDLSRKVFYNINLLLLLLFENILIERLYIVVQTTINFSRRNHRHKVEKRVEREENCGVLFYHLRLRSKLCLLEQIKM